jgi:hypothetical protein
MPDTGWLSFATFTSQLSGLAWSNPSYAQSDDGNYSSAGTLTTIGQGTQRLYGRNVGSPSIPSNAVVVGIEVRIERYASAANLLYHRVQVMDGGGTPQGDLKTINDTWSTSVETKIFGSSTDDWNAGFDGSDVLGSLFGIRTYVTNPLTQNTDVYIDYAEIKVYYEYFSPEPSTVAFAFTPVSPAISVDKAVSPNGISFSISPQSPSITVGTTVTPAAISFGFSPTTPTVEIDYSITPTATPFGFSLAAPTATVDKSVSTDPVTFGFAIASPTATPHKTVTPSPAAFAFTVNTPGVTSGGNVAPSPTTFSISVASPGVSVDKGVSPSPLALGISIPTPSVSVGKSPDPSTLPFTMTPVAPGISVDKTVSPLPVGFAFTVMNPAITIGPTVDAGRHIDTIIDLDYTMRPTVLEGGAAITTYLWEVVSEPMGATVTFSATSVEAPTVSFDTVGDYTLRLTVTDANGNDGDDTVTATVYLSLGGDPLYRSLPRKFV